MHRIPLLVPGLVILLVASVLLSGCSTSETGNPSAQTTTPLGAGPLFAAGDIVQNPASTSDTAWLVIGYDAASDTYERALVYRNAGGSWGYRSDNRTEKADRLVMEKVYTGILTNVLPSSVPVVTPVIVLPEETPWAGATATGAATTRIPTAPSVSKIFPEEGYTGTSVSITNLAGDNFVAGTSVTLSRNNSASFSATDVRIVSNTSITCTLAIPSDAAVGAWDVTVKNPDGQSDTFNNSFTVRKDVSAVSTTSAIAAGTVPITYIDPPVGHIGYSPYTITGSKFQSGASVTLLKDGFPDIVAVQTIRDSDTQLRCWIEIPQGSVGNWDILVRNPDATYGRLFGGFPIS